MFKLTTKKLTLLAIFMALGIILKSFLSLGNDSFRVSIWNIPLFLAGIVAGPFYGGICAFGADLIYGLCFTKFPFSFLMSLSCTIWGIAGGFLFNKKVKLHVIAIIVFVVCIIETSINSLYLYIYFDSIEYVLAGLPLRLGIQMARFIISTALIFAINKKFYNHV